MIDAPRRRCNPPQAVKTVAVLARVDRFPQRPVSQKVGFLQIGRATQTLCPSPCGFSRPQSAHLGRQAHFNRVSSFAFFGQPQSALGRQPPHSTNLAAALVAVPNL